MTIHQIISMIRLLARSLAKKPSQLATNNIKFTYQTRYQYSQLDRYLNRLNKPLYYYIIGLNASIFLLWNTPIIDKVTHHISHP